MFVLSCQKTLSLFCLSKLFNIVLVNWENVNPDQLHSAVHIEWYSGNCPFLTITFIVLYISTNL